VRPVCCITGREGNWQKGDKRLRPSSLARPVTSRYRICLKSTAPLLHALSSQMRKSYPDTPVPAVRQRCDAVEYRAKQRIPPAGPQGRRAESPLRQELDLAASTGSFRRRSASPISTHGAPAPEKQAAPEGREVRPRPRLPPASIRYCEVWRDAVVPSKLLTVRSSFQTSPGESAPKYQGKNWLCIRDARLVPIRSWGLKSTLCQKGRVMWLCH
jgi:hypothetical protein